MTEEEYEKLGKKQRTPDDLDEQPEPVTSNSETASNQGSATPAAATKAPSARAAAVIEEERKLEPISLAMLQGAFYILLLGYFFSGLFLALEIAVKKRKKRVRKPLHCLVVMDGFLKEFHVKFYKKSKFKVVDWSRRKLQEAIEEVAFDDLEYLD